MSLVIPGKPGMPDPASRVPRLAGLIRGGNPLLFQLVKDTAPASARIRAKFTCAVIFVAACNNPGHGGRYVLWCMVRASGLFCTHRLFLTCLQRQRGTVSKESKERF